MPHWHGRCGANSTLHGKVMISYIIECKSWYFVLRLTMRSRFIFSYFILCWVPLCAKLLVTVSGGVAQSGDFCCCDREKGKREREERTRRRRSRRPRRSGDSSSSAALNQQLKKSERARRQAKLKCKRRRRRTGSRSTTTRRTPPKGPFLHPREQPPPSLPFRVPQQL